jgi:hypothetical protein
MVGTAFGGGLRVEVLRELSKLELYARELSALNVAARRPTPFHTLEYFKIFLEHDERKADGGGPLWLLAFDGARPVGLLPLRRRVERLLGWPSERIELLMAEDDAGVALVARPDDEERCARAFVRHIFGRESGWETFELADQEQATALARAADELASPFLYVRRFPGRPCATIPLRRGFEGWLDSLSQPMRANLTSHTRALLDSGELELVSCADVSGARALLPLLLDIEARAGRGRHAMAVKRYEAMLRPGQPATPVFHFLRVGGLPVAGMMSLLFGDAAHQLELVTDETFEKHAVGSVLMMLGLRDLLMRGANAFQLRSDVSHAKARFGAEVVETAAVQVFRRVGAAHLKARAGELRRRVLGTALPHDAGLPRRERPLDPLVAAAARTKTAATMTALLEKGTVIDYLGSEALAQVVLPREKRAERMSA